MLENLSANQFLKSFTLELKNRECLPLKIELTEIGSTTIANSFDDARGYVISEHVSTGMSLDPSVAVLKSLVERIERNAYINGFKQKLKSCTTERSDGFAAYPVKAATNSKIKARDNAYSEAVERFIWSTWWDDLSIGHQQTSLNSNNTSPASFGLIEELSKIVKIKNVTAVIPQLSNSDQKTIISFAELEDGGFISGGASGTSDEHDITLYRGLCELVRHGIATHHFGDSQRPPMSFYEKRLHFFAFDPRGRELLLKRLNSDGTKSITLPKLAIDEEVPHALSDLVYVHRCYFENQPPFVGGELERFCL